MKRSQLAAGLPPDIEDRKATARTWFEQLRDRICAAFEAIEDDLSGPSPIARAGRFERTTGCARRVTGGGGHDVDAAWPRVRESRRAYLDRARRILAGVPQADSRRGG